MSKKFGGSPVFFQTLLGKSVALQQHSIMLKIISSFFFTGIIFSFAISQGQVDSIETAPRVAGAGGSVPAAAPTPLPCESVSLAGIEVVCLTRGVASFTRHDRVSSVTRRLQELARDLDFDPPIFRVEKNVSSFVIRAGENIVLSVGPEDINLPPELDFPGLGDAIAAKMVAAIEADRILRSPNALAWGAGKTLFVTLLLFLFLHGLGWSARRARERIQRSHGREIRSVKIQSFELLNAERIIAFLEWLVATARIVLTLVALYFYIPLVLSFFPWTASWSAKLFGYLVTPIIRVFSVMVEFIPNLFFILTITLVTRYVLKVIRFFFVEIERGNLSFDGFYREWADPTYKLVRVMIVAFALVMVFPYLPGSHSPAFQGISVFLGILLSLGSSSAIANIVAGVVLTYMRPFRLGDRVKIADTVGDVLEKNLLVTRIMSIKHVEITIPNSMVLGSHIVNFSSAARSSGLILNTTVTIGYDVAWRKVHALLIAAAERTGKIDLDSKPFVLQTALNDFYVAYELNVSTQHPNAMAGIYSELHQNIQDVFREAGVEIMSPHYSALRDGTGVALPEGAPENDVGLPGI